MKKRVLKMTAFMFVVGVLLFGWKMEAEAYTINYSTDAVSSYQGCDAKAGYNGQQGYINIWDPEKNNNMKTISYTVTKNGQQITSNSHTANNYINYCSFPITIYGTGTYSAHITVIDTNGNDHWGDVDFYLYDITPVVSSNPTTRAVKQGSSVSFSVSVAQGTNVEYQWCYSSDGGNTYYLISGATSPTYTIPSSEVTPSLNGRYYKCRLDNNNDTGKYVYSSAARLTVYSSPSVTSPTSVSVKEGNSASFQVSTSGGYPTSYTYQWYYTTSQSATGTKITGATSAVCSISSVTSDMDGRYYYCVVSNGQYDVTSSRAKLTVYSSPSVTSPTSVSVKEGDSTSFQVSASGGNPANYTYQWYYAISQSAKGTKLSRATSSVYTTSSVTSDMDGRYYYCVVSNGQYDVTSSRAKLTVYSSPSVTSPTSVSVKEGDSTSFQVSASGGNPANYTYQWYYATSQSATGTKLNGATSAVCSISSVTSDMDGRYYYCVVSNGQYDVASDRAKLTVIKEDIPPADEGNKDNPTEQPPADEANKNNPTEQPPTGGTQLNPSTPPAEIKPVLKFQKITASSYTKSYGSKPFLLNARTDGDGKLTYKSSNPKVVSVSADGKATVKTHGKVKITITASQTSRYYAASKTITVKVVPSAPAPPKVSSPSDRRISIRWKKYKNVTGYELNISPVSNFKTQTIKRSYKVPKTRVVVVGFPSGKDYYIRMRTYKAVGKTRYNSGWSRVMKVRVK